MKSKLLTRLIIGSALSGAALAVGVSFAHHPPAPAPLKAASTAAAWLEDIRPAMAMARALQKDVLIEFSAPQQDAASVGTLEKDVLEQESFRANVGRSFVLVRLASSNDLSPARLTQVTTCAERLGVAKFPTFVLLDSEGRPYAKSELVASDAAEYEKEFTGLAGQRIARDKAMALAANEHGAARAKHLDEALVAVGSFAETEYVDVRREVVELDSTNAAGLKAKYEPAIVARQIDSTIQSDVYPLVDRGDYPGAITRIDKLISEVKPTPPQLQLMIAFKGQLFYSLGNKQQASELMDKAISLDPSSEAAARARAAKEQMAGNL